MHLKCISTPILFTLFSEPKWRLMSSHSKILSDDGHAVMYRSLCKLTEGSKLKFPMTNKCFDSTQLYNYHRRTKINWNRVSIIDFFL